jgi:hypothetical protein
LSFIRKQVYLYFVYLEVDCMDHHMASLDICKNTLYAKVLVREITDMACIDYPLDHVTPKGIKELGEDVN